MAWDEEPPKEEELQWMSEPPKPEELEAPVIGSLEATARGVGQGATFGFSDEAQAAAKAAFEANREGLPPGPVGDVLSVGKTALDVAAPSQALIQHVLNRVSGRAKKPSDMVDTYRKNLTDIRGREHASAEQKPWLYHGGEFAGAALTAPLLPGAGEVKAASAAAKLAALAKTGAKLGATMAAGSSEADLTKGEVGQFGEDVAEGTALGVATAPVALVGESAVNRALKIVGNLGKRLIPSMFGPSEEAVAARLSRPDDIIKAKTYGDLAEEMPSALQKIKDRIKMLSGTADETLSTSRYLEEGAISKDEVMSAVKLARSKVGGEGSSGVFSPDAKAAAGALENATEFYKKLGNTVSQKQVKTLINQLDDQIPWKRPYMEWSPTDRALANVRGRLDGLLKTKNPSYAKAMVPVDDEVRLLSDARQKFRVIDRPGQEMRPSDTTAGAIRGGMREERVDTQRIMDKMKGSTGMDIGGQARDTMLAEEFTPSRTQKAFDFTRPVASTIRAVAGKPSEQAAADLIDWYVKNKPDIFGKFTPMLADAVQRGTLAVTNYVLQQRDPEYQALIRGLADAEEGREGEVPSVP